MGGKYQPVLWYFSVVLCAVGKFGEIWKLTFKNYSYVPSLQPEAVVLSKNTIGFWQTCGMVQRIYCAT